MQKSPEELIKQSTATRTISNCYTKWVTTVYLNTLLFLSVLMEYHEPVHQLVRFRIGVSFTQRSQRYTDESSLQTITPPSITNNEKTIKLYNEYLEYSQITYSNLLQQGIPREDARFVLPNASSTSLIMTMNYRELIHACGLRLCSKAQWEIQDLFTEIKKEIHCLDPFLGKYLQPKCIHNGFCSERKPCKTPETIQSQWKKLHT